VKRTFSKQPQFSTGLSREKTLKADRKEIGNFIEVISMVRAGREHWNHPVARLQMLSVLRKNQKNLSLSERVRKGNKRYACRARVQSIRGAILMVIVQARSRDPQPAQIAPTGDGYMPLYCAAQWIATAGHAVAWDVAADEVWTQAYR